MEWLIFLFQKIILIEIITVVVIAVVILTNFKSPLDFYFSSSTAQHLLGLIRHREIQPVPLVKTYADFDHTIQ